jgi:hypothetical protein
MFDPNIQDFYERVGRLNKAHAAGDGFIARGMLSRSDFRHHQRKSKAKMIFPVVFLLMAVFALKGTIYHFVGAQTYEIRVAELKNGAGFDRLGATLMMADPATRWMAKAIGASVVRMSADRKGRRITSDDTE